MPRVTFNKYRGFSLLEGVISLFLVAISGLGVAYTLAASIKSQVTDNVQNIVLSELRGKLASNGVQTYCSTFGASSSGTVMILNRDLQSTANVTYDETCHYINMDINVNSISETVAVPQFTITVSDARIGKYDLVIQN